MADAAVEALVALLGLAPHPEGGYYRETFRSATRIARLGGTPGRADEARAAAAATAIYFLLPGGTFSAWHTVASDEAWHHYEGAAVELHTIDPAGAHQVAVLGHDLRRGERPQRVVPAGWLQAARPVAPAHADAPAHALCGCTVSPGFEFADFELPARSQLHRRFPQLAAVIDALTRP